MGEVFEASRKRVTAALKRRPGLKDKLKITIGYDGDKFDQAMRTADALFSRQFDRKDLAKKAPNLRWIHAHGAGVYHLMPLDWLPPGAVFTNSRGVHRPKADEYTIMAILMLNTRLPEIATNQRRATWDQLYNTAVEGKTLLIVLHHERRRIVLFGVTAHPTAMWIRQQITEAFPWDRAPRYIIRDRDSAYGRTVSARIEGMETEEVVTAPRSPWQNPFVERVIGSIRRECLDHVIVFNEGHLRCLLTSYLAYYHDSRTHLLLNKDPPVPRPVCSENAGKIIAFPQVGGLHHRYERMAA